MSKHSTPPAEPVHVVNVRKQIAAMEKADVYVSDYNKELLAGLAEELGEGFRIEPKSRQIALIFNGAHIATLRRPQSLKICLLLPHWRQDHNSFPNKMLAAIKTYPTHSGYTGEDPDLAVDILRRHYNDLYTGVAMAANAPRPQHVLRELKGPKPRVPSFSKTTHRKAKKAQAHAKKVVIPEMMDSEEEEGAEE